MKTRICPLCDQPMKKPHHCDNCNSFIWKPNYIDIHYSSDVMSGDDCSYDAMPHKYDYHDDGTVTMTPEQREDYGKPVKPERNFQLDEGYTPAGNYKPDETFEPKKVRKPRSGKMITIIVVVLILLTILPEIIMGIVSVVRSESMNDENPGIIFDGDDEDDLDFDYDSSSNEKEFTDEEVIAQGEECNGSYHMDITAEEFFKVMEPALDKLDVDTADYNESSNNHAYIYGSTTSTYYDTDRMYHLDDSVGYYYDVVWDTVSGRLHDVGFNVTSRDGTEAFFEATMEALTGDGESFMDEFKKNRETAEEETYVFYNTDEYEVYINYTDYSDDGSGSEVSYYISITQAM